MTFTDFVPWLSAPEPAGNWRDLAQRPTKTIRETILERGGNAANVRHAGHWAEKSLAETAEAAVRGDKSAQTAIKIAKQAKRLGEKQ